MAYFLKKSKLKKGIYLQIYESFYDPQRGYQHINHTELWGMLTTLLRMGLRIRLLTISRKFLN